MCTCIFSREECGKLVISFWFIAFYIVSRLADAAAAAAVCPYNLCRIRVLLVLSVLSVVCCVHVGHFNRDNFALFKLVVTGWGFTSRASQVMCPYVQAS